MSILNIIFNTHVRAHTQTYRINNKVDYIKRGYTLTM